MNPLSRPDRVLCRLFVAIVLGLWDEVSKLRAHAAEGEPDRRWRETLLQVHVFAGFPRAVEAYNVLGRAGGLGRPEPGEVHATRRADAPGVDDTDGERRMNGERARGRVLFATIYGEHADTVRGALESYHADFADWLESHAYGRVLARDGLAADRRELLAVCALAALGQERQLASHARGALRCGAMPDELHAALDEVADLVHPDRVEKARRVIERFL